MSRYIDANKLKKSLSIPCASIIEIGKAIIAQIGDQPTADVVEVVRCKDCKHRIYDGSRDLYYCNMYYGMGDVSNDNYCSYGERADT